MNKILISMIFVLSINLFGSDISSITEKVKIEILKENAQKMARITIRPNCRDLFQDYVFFYDRTKTAYLIKDPMFYRWYNITEKYRKTFLDCNKLDNNKRYYNANPLNRAPRENLK